ncbi:hypothetical protein KDX27_30315 [Burkholderia cenocepacia]|uniref:hypothetical protein n=1 Tax=Burkholderia cenocepacia TaxID=95486 RepID=UPI001B927E9D|nr:hypothetical protein [Burkholderia cenocepacia]MBR8028900.1 hypothetical protein [Burkholderia cenocepacia]MBR8172028.1 hypothetical protein [Burkholderia cenocepacia]MBR8426942.1 hypothetical protein [Burkholderia cenocepacia]
MSGDWIKMSADLSEDPIVIAIAARLGVDEFSVVGRLHRIWSWADRHLADGLALGITPEWIDQFVRLDGFSTALIEVGWLYRFDKESVIDPQQSLIDSASETFIDSSLSFIDSYRNLIDSQDEGGLGGVVFPRFFRFLTGKTTTKTKTKTNPTSTRAREIDNAIDKATDKGIDNEIDKASVQIDKDERFASFWKLYPRKDAKVQARKAFLKLAPSAELLEQILDALDRFKRCDQWVREDGKFIPFASTWLNQRRWEDESTPGMRPQPQYQRMTADERRRAISDANAAAFLAGIPTNDPNVIDMEH